MARFLLEKGQEAKLVEKIKKALGRPNPTVLVVRDFFVQINPKKEKFEDKIKGICVNARGIIITLRKTGQIVVPYSVNNEDTAVKIYPDKIIAIAETGDYTFTVK